MKKSVKFVNSVKNVFLSEPFTINGRHSLNNIGIHMTKDEFYNDGVYIEPFSEYEKTEYDNNDADDSDVISYSDEVDLNALKILKENFENKIMNLDGWLFIIKGVAGCGKTTYLNKLSHDLSSDMIFHIFNFEDTRQAFGFMSKSFDLKKLYCNNVFKFSSLLLKEISTLISKVDYDDEKEHRNYIQKIVNVYNRSFMVSEEDLLKSELSEPNIDITEQQDLFNVLQRYASMEIEYSILSENLLNKFASRLNTDVYDESETLAYIVGFIIRLYYCIGKVNNTRHICAVDNIETFVKFDEEHPIQVCELEKIINGFFIASKKAREILDPWQRLENYNAFYSFTIITRDTTASTALCAVQHEDDYKKENEVDISNWYCTQDILNSKENFFIKKGFSPVEDCYSEAYQNLLCDFSAYRWGLNGIISKMYKHSHRRNIECIPDVLAVVPEDEIMYFNEMWNKAKGRDRIKSSLKYVCRKYILRILIDHVQRKNYFSNLMVEDSIVNNSKRTLETVLKVTDSAQIHDERSSYARKISTLLHRFSLENGNERYVSFPRIIHSILRLINLPDEPTSTNINNLAKILFLMNETRNELTNWTSLVCIKFDNKEIYSESNLCTIMQREWNDYKSDRIGIDDTTKFGVRITEAGSFFAKIIADFEYFGCRFLLNEPPLFSLKNIKPIYINGRRSYRAVEIIAFIRKKAFSCIDEVVQRDRHFFSSMEQNGNIDFSYMYESDYSWIYKETINDSELVHPLRIINQHMGYISHYLDYIEQFVPKEKFEQEGDKINLINQVKRQLFLYYKKMQNLMKENPGYFRIE